MLNMVYAPIKPLEHAERIAHAALQQHINLITEFTLRRVQTAVLAEKWKTARLLLGKLPRKKDGIAPSFSSVRALTICPDLRTVQELDGVVAPHFVYAWITGKLRDGEAVKGDLSPVRLNRPILKFWRLPLKESLFSPTTEALLGEPFFAKGTLWFILLVLCRRSRKFRVERIRGILYLVVNLLIGVCRPRPLV